MHIAKHSFIDCPGEVVAMPFDLVWVRCAGLAVGEPFQSHTLQWIDWNLQGQVQRWWLKKKTGRALTFLPSFGKLASPMLVLDVSSELQVDELGTTCKGLLAQQVLILCRDVTEANATDKLLRHHKSSDLPERVVIGSDQAVGRS